MKKYTKHSGFTLVELLIVIAVIAVLASTMLLSSSESVASARASTIIADLTNLKSAVLQYYAEHCEEIDSGASWPGLSDDVVVAEIAKYLGPEDARKFHSTDWKYSFGGGSNTYWFVWCEIPQGETKVKQRLEARAPSVGLYLPNANETNKANAVLSDDSGYYKASKASSNYVGMLIR